jgi:hypothetical protein
MMIKSNRKKKLEDEIIRKIQFQELSQIKQMKIKII